MKPRYIRVQVEAPQPVEGRDFKESVWNTLLQLFGEYGASKTKLWLIGYDAEKQRGTLRCSRETLHQVRAAISMVTAVKDAPAALHVISVSGTLRKLWENETQT